MGQWDKVNHVMILIVCLLLGQRSQIEWARFPDRKLPRIYRHTINPRLYYKSYHRQGILRDPIIHVVVIPIRDFNMPKR